jgi:FkbM family methyltransferase
MARLCPKVFAFEPNPKMYRFLEAAAAHNVQCHNIALSDQAGEAKLLVPGAGARFSNQGASLNPTRMGDGAFATVTVEARTLDSYALPPIGFIKIDVEGHERAVIAGARKLIARDKPRLIVEIEARHTGTPVRTLTDEIEALGYRMMFNTPDGLRDGRYFDPDTMQCETNAKSAYINNFIFLPI